MTVRLYIDPSITCTGVALFIDGLLQKTGILRPTTKSTNRLIDLYRGSKDFTYCELIKEIYYEAPQLRVRGKGAKPEDLFKLSMAVGAVVAGADVGATTALHPVKITSWKGQLPKEVTHEHMWRVLTEDEQRTLEVGLEEAPKSLAHNAYDAVCIGLYIEGRATWVRRKGRR